MIVIALLSLAALTPAQKEAHARVAPGPKVPRGEVLEWTSAQGQPYWYRVPKKVEEGNPPSLILMLHGTGMPWGWAFWNYPIASGAFRGDDIVVAPEGLTPGGGKTFNFVQGPKDGEQIAGIIQAFNKAFPIDRVYLYGHSQGAFFCYWFAGEHPELIDGIVAHAGNVLSVKHPKLAKSKVGIGILHGEADAVVPVACAYRTEKIYREQGYEKVKLYVVEGLTAQSGHWPLPKQVSEMLAWLDQVTAKTPGQAIETALSELAKEAPDVAVIADAVARGADLLKRYRGDDKDPLGDRLSLLEDFIEAAVRAHAAALLADEAVADRKLPFGPWVGHFRAVQAAFADARTWKKEMKAALTLAKKQQRKVASGLRAVASGRRGFAAAVKALAGGYLAPDYDSLEAGLRRLIEAPPEGIGEKDIAACRAILEERAAPLKAGREAAVGVTAELARSFLEDHPEILGDG
jgi:predicted esterase